ncbi:MAG: MBL fold metallo-hydrolase, partial [Candidatus Latescibacteria bacterium]|nr:MBL fold metallo-hydrolase [Candidatus Latescibacterota bacterium]
PPNLGGSSTTARGLRQHAMLKLDETMHLIDAPTLAPVKEFFRRNIETAIEQIQREKMSNGATVWKLYNHGFVVKTENHCWAHDLVRGTGEMNMTDEQLGALIGEIDALFCSHWHGDHISSEVAKKALKEDVPVFVAPLPTGDWGEAMVERLGSARDSDGFHILELGGSGRLATTDGALMYHAYPGHQGELENCVFAVSADGMTIMQTGDQSNDDDFSWIDTVGDGRAVDVLLPNVWTNDMRRVITGVKPRAVIPGHENELGHSFEHREPYDQAYEKLSALDEAHGIDWYVLAWGERMHIDARR